MRSVFTEHPFSFAEMSIFTKSYHTKFAHKIKKKRKTTTVFNLSHVTFLE